jgi:hypothetical protein
MTELRIGAPKAKAVLDALETDPAPAPALLHVVQAPDSASVDPVPVPDSDPVDPVGPVDPDPVPQVGSDPVGSAPVPVPVPVSDPVPVPDSDPVPSRVDPQASGRVDPVSDTAPQASAAPRSWPVWLLAAPAFVAIWAGWVGLGQLTGFGMVHPLPGIWDSLELNSAITLPIGVETYAAFALRVWLSGSTGDRARNFAKWSAIGSLVLGAAGQVAYHLMSAAGITSAPWQITTLVACLPVAVLGMGAALAHLLRAETH